MSGLSTTTKVSVPTSSAFTFSAGSTSKEFLKYFESASTNFSTFTDEQAADANDLFADLVDGVYTVELKSTYAAGTKSGLYGRIAIADLPLGAHSFKVVKTYPDGRVETVEDRAQVTAVDANQVAVFGTATLTGIDNAVIRNNFLINEVAYVEGQYKYEFTIAGVSKTYIVNVEEAPGFSISDLKIGSTVGALLGTTYTFSAEPTDYAASKVTIEFDTINLAEDIFVTIEEASGGDAQSKFTPNTLANGVALTSIVKLKLSDLEGVLILGDLAIWGNPGPTSTNFVAVELKFWKKLDYSVLGNGNLFELVGEKQTIKFGFLTVIS
jgi:hypothetical protein